MDLLDISDEILCLIICQFLTGSVKNFNAINNFRLVSKRCQAISDDNYLWKKISKLHWHYEKIVKNDSWKEAYKTMLESMIKSGNLQSINIACFHLYGNGKVELVMRNLARGIEDIWDYYEIPGRTSNKVIDFFYDSEKSYLLLHKERNIYSISHFQTDNLAILLAEKEIILKEKERIVAFYSCLLMSMAVISYDKKHKVYCYAVIEGAFYHTVFDDFNDYQIKNISFIGMGLEDAVTNKMSVEYELEKGEEKITRSIRPLDIYYHFTPSAL